MWGLPFLALALTAGVTVQDRAPNCWICDEAAFGDEVTWVLCDSGLIYQTADSGATWTVARACQVRARTAALGSPAYALVAGASGLLMVTEDAGRNWRQVDTGGHSHLNAIAGWGDHAWVAGNEGTILHSADRGRTWRLQNAFTRSNLESLWFLDELRGWAVGWNGAILRTTNGGEFSEPVPAAGIHHPLTGVHFRNAHEGWAVGVPGLILHTTNGGQSWTRLASPDPGWLRSIFFTPEGVGYVAGDGVLASYDGGQTWRPLPLSSGGTLVALVLQKGRLWAFGSHTVAVNGGGGTS